MPNHNVEITKPDGATNLALDENVNRGEAEIYLNNMGLPPKGWFYKIVNLHVKKPRRSYDSVLIGIDFSKDDAKIVDQRLTGIKAGEVGNEKWYTRKKARRDLRALGATHFISKKVAKT